MAGLLKDREDRPRPGSNHSRLFRQWRPGLAFAAMALLALALVRSVQVHAGAEQARFGAYPDEPAHYLSGLMVRDYIANGFPGSPITYAVNYYLHVPYFAVGHWPPLFYLLEGLWMMLFGPGRAAVLWLIAIIPALVAATIFVEARRSVGVPGAACAGALFCLMPQVQWSNNLVMTDTAIALLGLWSALLLGRYLDTARTAFAFGFGVLTGLTFLTKYSGLFLVLLPIPAVLLCRRWRLLRRGSFWLPPLLVAAIWIPWLALTKQYARTTEDVRLFRDAALLLSGHPVLAHSTAFFGKLALCGKILLLSNGPVLGALLMLGWVLALVQWQKLNGLEVVLFLQPLAVLVFLVLAPVDVEERYALPAVPPLILLMCFSIGRVTKWAQAGRMAFSRHWATAFLVVFTLFYGRWALLSSPLAKANDLRPIVDFVLQGRGLRNASILVPADAEGPAIAEFAMRDPGRGERILARPNKLFSKRDWLGTTYEPYYATSSEIEEYFEENPIDIVIVRKILQGNVLPHERLLEDALKQLPDRWKLVAEFPSGAGGYEVFQFARPAVWNHPTPFFVKRMTSRFAD